MEANKHEEITFSQEFIFVFIPHFIGAISSKKMSKDMSLEQRCKGGWEVGLDRASGCLQEALQAFCTLKVLFTGGYF